MKLSIITINYNNLTGLQRTIDSVVCQTWHDYEWIIIDGGSTDGSKELIEQYQEYITYWCSEPDKGIYNAMNKGIDHAHGDYLIFMNSGDDFASKDVLEKVWKEDIKADIHIGVVVNKENGTKVDYHNRGNGLFIQIFTGSLCHQGTFIKRTLLLRFPYDENYKIVSDWKFWIEAIILNGYSVSFSDIIVAHQEMGGISRTRKEMNTQERKDVLQSLFSPMLLNELYNYINLQKEPIVFISQHFKKNGVIFYKVLEKISYYLLFVYSKIKLFKKSNSTHFN